VTVADPYVTLTDGTGIVHIAPAFGEDDARIGRAITTFRIVQLVAEDGHVDRRRRRLRREVFTKEADDASGRAFASGHLLAGRGPSRAQYPFCWRCDTPLDVLRAFRVVHRDDARYAINCC
jgi:isoleucyl-tRNA synthetase